MNKFQSLIFSCVSCVALGCSTTEIRTLSTEEASNKALNLLATAKNTTQWQRVQLVNNWVNNAMEQSEDITIWGEEDYWASPLEAISKRVGDCEDYAITKYFFLREAGIPTRQLFLSHVEYANQTAPHMVLIYHNENDNGYYVLDNIITHIKPWHNRQDLQYKFSFNEKAVFTGSPSKFLPINGSSPSQINQWRKTLSKWNMEKLTLKAY
jgi:predicted transglutaminase-like cysteine proteinase